MKTCLHGPILRVQFGSGDLDLPERRGIPVVEGRRKMHRCALGAKQETRTHSGRM